MGAKWSASGEYMETCSCDFLCPCISKNMTTPATHDFCKVALAFEDQLVAQVPMESHDKHVDIIITDKRIIYKI